ncbi:hypothetical protein KQI63_04085 [bacterium]|nr:hypothetical protein [bacterium]
MGRSQLRSYQFYSILASFSILVVITDTDDLASYGLWETAWRTPILIGAIILIGVLVGELAPRVLVWTSRAFDVTAPLVEVRKVTVLSLIPFLPVLLLMLMNEIMMLGFFNIPNGELGVLGWIMISGAFLLFIPIALAGLALTVWQISIVSRCFAEVFQYPAWKATVHLAFVGILLFSAITVVAVPLGMLLYVSS